MAAREIPIWEKANLTLEESAQCFGIGVNKLRELTNQEDINCVLWVGNKRLIKREVLEEYLIKMYSI